MPAKKKPTTTLGMLGLEPYKEKKGEAYMNEKQLTHFTAVLDAWKGQLMVEVDTTINNMKDAIHYADPADRASQEEEFSLELRTRDRERKLLRKIEKTLKKIETEAYGFCEACEEEIGIRRLEARPTAEQCIDCKTLSEIKERQFGT